MSLQQYFLADTPPKIPKCETWGRTDWRLLRRFLKFDELRPIREISYRDWESKAFVRERLEGGSSLPFAMEEFHWKYSSSETVLVVPSREWNVFYGMCPHVSKKDVFLDEIQQPIDDV